MVSVAKHGLHLVVAEKLLIRAGAFQMFESFGYTASK